MHRLKGSPHIIVLLFYFTCLWAEVVGICPIRCNCDDENLRVECDSANLDVVPITLNPELVTLQLNNNHIKNIGTSFSVYRNLRYLDVSYNQLVSIGNKSFSVQEKLETLILTGNMVAPLYNETFIGLVHLETLLLNENHIEEIKTGIFAPLTNLQKLDLSQNRLASVSENAFHGLSNLKTLLLRDNKLVNIPTRSFHKVPKLLDLNLGLNSFANIPEDAFSSLKELETLSLDGCGIKTIQTGAFNGLGSLLVLKIHDNELQEVPTKALFDVVRLKEIHLGQNKFPLLRPLAFQNLKYLMTVEINGAPEFQRIEKGAFSDNTDLNKIVMTHNKKFNLIQQGTFEGLSNLRYVNLRGNAFAVFDMSLLTWDELDHLDLRDNPLTCNCSLLWLWNLLHSKNGSSSPLTGDTYEVMCASPPSLKSKFLQDLSVSDLDCYREDTRRQIIIGVVVAAAVAFAAIIMLGFRFRDRVAGVLKSKWGTGSKEPQYHKTNGDDDTTICQAAQQPLKMIPVTEL